jgi:diguanylate cyclase (GGDEF)-like protein
VKFFKTRLALFIIAWIFGLFLLYFNFQYQVNDSISLIVESRSDIIRQHVDLALSIVDKMSEQMTSNIELAEMSNFKHPARIYIQNYPDKNIYGADGFEASKSDIPLPKASLTGSGSFPIDNIETDREINAALSLNLSISSNISSNPDFVWSYYTSKRNFIYIWPKVHIKDFYFSNTLYEKPFWLVATPENNPARKTVISDVYNDEYGQGLMFTISSPVYWQDEFRGVCSLDLGLKELRESLSVGFLEGSSLLVDEDGHLVASLENFKIGEILDKYQNILSHKNSYVSINGSEYFVHTVVDDELYIVHKISTKEKIWKIIKDMTFHVVVYTGVLLVLFLLFQLKITLDRATELAITDSLTGLYNRRAMEDHSNVYFEHSERLAGYVTVLILDIDHFKKINDSYGHAVGDEAIRSVANVLRRICRKADLLGRVGGEEFLVVSSANDIESSINIAERIRTTIESEVICDGLFSLTVSIGCVRRRPQESYESAVQRADKALYEAKNQGRNRVVVGNHI